MASKTQREAGPGDAAGALDRLYAAPFDDFVPTRREMVAALRAGGDVVGARAVAAAAKPSRTAWALNQVARNRPELLAAALEARTKAAAAQTSGDALRASARAYRDCLAALVQAAGEALHEGGGELTALQGRRISATVQAIAGADDAGAREALLAGRLVADVDVDDPFAGLEAGPVRERPETRSPTVDRAALPPRHGVKRSSEDVSTLEKAREREKQAREREKLAQEREQERQAAELEKARAKVAALEDEARQARVAAREAEVAAGRARAEAERLRRAVEAVEKRLSDAKGDLRSRS
jgi:hypothetical protein